MPELILHQYAMSPFSEKVRRILAFKNVRWRSVRAPAVMPKPDLVPLTGGYRKIPVLQIGNHVYCDTALIARVVDGLAPSPPLYGFPMAEAVAQWADYELFEAAAVVGMRPTRFEDALALLTPEELQKIGEDRLAMRNDARKKTLPFAAAKAHLAAYLDRLESELAERPYLLGSAASIADFAVYHSLWFLERLAPEPLAPFPRVRGFMERVSAFTGTPPVETTAEEALRICRESTAEPPRGPIDEGLGVAANDRVAVRAADYGRDPVLGTLVFASRDRIAIRREDARAGVVYVHFPRIGYEVMPAPGEAAP
jgi:glutathione S-transferase